MTARTILEHTDDVLALPAGTWLVATAAIWGMPEEGGRVDIPTGTRLRVSWSIGERLEAHTVDARRLTIWREQLAHVEREPADGSRQDATLLPNKLRHLAAMLDRGAAIRLEPADMSMLSARFDAQVGAAVAAAIRAWIEATEREDGADG